LFGLVLAALTAALMSTVDTLITAVAAVAVNDVYKPHFRPNATDRQLLTVARISAVVVTLVGVGLVPVFMNFKSVYTAHAAFTAAVTPPMVVALLFAVFWRRFTAKAALWTLVGGMIAVVFSMVVPEVITPFAHGVPGGKSGGGFLDGMRQHQFMRACYGISVCMVIGIVVTLLTRRDSEQKQRGLVWGTISDALRYYKGSAGAERPPVKAEALPANSGAEAQYVGAGKLPVAIISRSLATRLQATAGDLLYVSDARSWTGGLHSGQVIISAIDETPGEVITLDALTFKQVVVKHRQSKPVSVERLY
jgi:solute:Na+ symporter, SSS family